MHSRLVEGTALLNTRDLGVLPAAEGKTIRHCRLIRSGALSLASDEDVRLLSEVVRVRHVVDFRTPVEHDRNPNPFLTGAREHHLPTVAEETIGITRDQSPLDQALFGSINFDATGYMQGVYRGIVMSPQGQNCYRTLFEILLACEEGAVLWHCSVGKDRTGIASYLVEHALGVPREVIEGDYLATNAFNEPINTRDRDRLLARIPQATWPQASQKIDALFEARLEYLQTAIDAMAERFGSTDGYLEQALGVTPARRDRLRELYLR